MPCEATAGGVPCLLFAKLVNITPISKVYGIYIMEVFNQIRRFFRIPRLIVEFMVIMIFWFVRMTVPTGTDDWGSHLAVILHLPEM